MTGQVLVVRMAAISLSAHSRLLTSHSRLVSSALWLQFVVSPIIPGTVAAWFWSSQFEHLNLSGCVQNTLCANCVIVLTHRCPLGTCALLPPPQNLDSSEISLTDVSHYFDSDPTKLVQSLRTDGKGPNAYIADTTTANGQVRGALFFGVT